MGVHKGPKIVTDGLILDLDISNQKSFVDAANTSLINTSTWTAGNTAVTGYDLNGATNENSRFVTSSDPWGNANMVWGSFPNGSNEGDGGWNTSYPAIDRTKLYRFSVWVRRTSSTTGGTFYFGLYGNGPTFAIRRNDNSATEGNPYWDCVNISSFTQNVWYLVTGHVYPAGTTYTGAHPDTGVYTVAGGTTKVRAVNFCNIGSDVQWLADNTSAAHRTYHFYCADNTSRLEFAYPRMEMCDGNQPSIRELLQRSPAALYDTSGRGNHHFLQGYYVPNSAAPRKFDFSDGTHWISRSGALAGVTSTCTVVMWYSTTDTQELWARGNQNNSVYLAASYGNDYYHSSAGSPTNFVDLKTVTNPETPVDYRDGNYHMWEAKGVDFSGWTYFDWFGYPSAWGLAGKVSRIMVYNKNLSADESARNFAAMRGRYGV
jgi:hypothetical protein